VPQGKDSRSTTSRRGGFDCGTIQYVARSGYVLGKNWDRGQRSPPELTFFYV